MLREMAPQDRPREKMARAGAAALGDNELLAVLLGSGTHAKSALMLAGEVLARAGGTGGLTRITLDELTALDGVGPTRAARVLAAVELGRRALSGGQPARPRLASPPEVARYLMPLYGGHQVERVGVALLDTKLRLIRTTILSVGSLDASIVHPREVFREALLSHASAIVVFHNHPSGDPAPSRDDIELTHRLFGAGRLMGIEVADHVILGDGKWFSFKESMRL